ncbi:MAG: DUF885 domain-containing protein [Acidobacteriota bacterium]
MPGAALVTVGRSIRAGTAPIALALLLPGLLACRNGEARPVWSEIRARYLVGFLKRNPVINTYLGGDGLSETLREVNGLLPDVTPAGRAEATEFYRSILGDLGRVDVASLSADDAIDREIVRAQIRFLLHMEEDLRFPRRSLETYIVAPFRGVDWQIQQMIDLGGGRHGTEEEWDLVVRRVAAVPAFLRAARANLEEGIREGEAPDRRMVRRDGIDAAADNAVYFRETLPALAERYLAGRPHRDRIVAALRAAGRRAAAAVAEMRAFREEAYRPFADRDRFMLGEREYDWRLRNNLRLPPADTASALFDLGRRKVLESQDLLIDAAREVARRRGLRLRWEPRARALRSVRSVMDGLSRDHPRDDEEMFRIYRTRAQDLVEFARRHAMFDLPDDYRLEIVPTPPMLESTLEAAYYPAPAFKEGGRGRFYLTASHGDPGVLRENNVHAVAALCAHEGFPGHDWHHRFMRSAKGRSISAVRWLTPGAVEDTSSMWQDSMAAEGWALYAEQLMAEPRAGAPHGFYSPEERLYQLKWQVLRDARVHIDTGLHTGRMGFDEAVDYFLANVDLLPDACAAPASDPVREAVCHGARRAIYRYSKWPTQAITYSLGKRDILDLRARVRAVQGERFSLRAFHERFLSAGTVPVGYVRERFLEQSRSR